MCLLYGNLNYRHLSPYSPPKHPSLQPSTPAVSVKAQSSLRHLRSSIIQNFVHLSHINSYRLLASCGCETTSGMMTRVCSASQIDVKSYNQQHHSHSQVPDLGVYYFQSHHCTGGGTVCLLVRCSTVLQQDLSTIPKTSESLLFASVKFRPFEFVMVFEGLRRL